MSTDVSAVTNHFPEPQDGFTTTTSGSVSGGATTVGLNSTGSYSNGDVDVWIIDPADSTKKQAFTGVVDTGGSQITGVKWLTGTNQAHSSGATVVGYATASHIAMMTKGVLVQHKQDGTHANTITTDTINENTGANGVTIDGLNIKDAKLTTSNSVVTANITDGDVTSEKLGATIACRAYRNAAQNIEVGTEIIVFDTENFDLGSDFDTSTGQFTAPYTGYYQVNAACQLPNVNAGGDQLLIHIYVNGSIYSTGGNNYVVAAGDDPRVTVSDLVPATAGQTIEIRIQNASSSTESIGTGSSNTYMSVYFVGAA
jgi:hypothetical protein